LRRNTGEARLIPRGTPGEMVELLDWDEFVKYLDELRDARNRVGSRLKWWNSHRRIR
jgi:type IV secretion system protein VirD4